MTKSSSPRRKSVLPTLPKRAAKSAAQIPAPVAPLLPEENAKPAPAGGSKSVSKPQSATAKLLASAKAAAAPAATKPAATPAPRGKLGEVEALLRRKTGATLAELMAATEWQAHTVRGVISGALRKRKGLTVEATRENGVSRYRIAA